MDAAAQQVAGGFVDHAMACHGVLARKGGGDDGQLEMPATTGASVTDMKVGFVLDIDRLRLQNGQPLGKESRGFRAQAGKTFLNGLTVTLA